MKSLKFENFTWVDTGEMKSTFELLVLMKCPGHNPNLHPDVSREQPCILVSARKTNKTKQKARNLGQEMIRTDERSVAPLKLEAAVVFQCYSVFYRFPNQSPPVS